MTLTFNLMFIIPILHFLQFFEIFRRNLPIFSLETPTEISHAIHTYHKEGDLTDAILTLQKQMLRHSHLYLRIYSLVDIPVNTFILR